MELDKPVADHSGDRFQRYNFAKRIAQTILTRTLKDSLTIGLYGKWGEGKTSVIEFVSRELDQKAIIVRFNPWQFAGEQLLLMAFFEQLAEAVNISLLSKGDKVAKKIRAYGGLATLGKFIPKEAVESFASLFSKASLSGHHKTISEALSRAEYPIVVFIDDIDRLESTEIQAVFKLVKVVADFPNIVYVLAFDPDRVIDALKGTFGDGQAYLEKIIQVPLTLPKAQPDALGQYTYDLISQAMNQPELFVPDEELNFFRKNFDKYLANYIVTPRDPVRISNAIRFSLPMLSREAHIGDLMLLETIKVLQPSLYQSIRNESSVYLRVYSSLYSPRNYEEYEESKKQAMAKIKSHLAYLPDLEQTSVKQLLLEMFPQLRTLYNNISYGSDEPINRWRRQKRICSDYHFDRYFTYAVIEGQISDIKFENFLSILESDSVESAILYFKDQLADVKPFTFIEKLQVYESSFSKEKAAKLAQFLCQSSDYFYIKDNRLFGIVHATLSLLKKCIYLQNEEDRNELILSLLETVTSLVFALKLLNELHNEQNGEGEERTEKPIDLSSIEPVFLNRFINEIHEDDLLAMSESGDLRTLLTIWSQYDTFILQKYLLSLLKSNTAFSLALLKTVSYGGVSFSGGKTETYNTPIREEDYKLLMSAIDVDELNKCLLNYYGKQTYIARREEDRVRLTDMELVGQFQQMYGLQERGQSLDN